MIFYRIYQIFIMIPLMLVTTIVTATITILGSMLGFGRWWGYHPARIWAKIFCLLTFVKVSYEGRENIDEDTSYVFVANHQGAYDIFAIYGYLNHNFRWMMKKALERIPLVGYSCRVSGQIYVDNSSAKATRTTMETAEKQLKNGMSVVVFPEGSRTPDGHLKRFKRGAYILAKEFGLPVVPITIDGAYDVMPRNAKLPKPGHIKVTIHKPIVTAGLTDEEMANVINQSREVIASALPDKNK